MIACVTLPWARPTKWRMALLMEELAGGAEATAGSHEAGDMIQMSASCAKARR
jgi:hypothetical protein